MDINVEKIINEIHKIATKENLREIWDDNCSELDEGEEVTLSDLFLDEYYSEDMLSDLCDYINIDDIGCDYISNGCQSITFIFKDKVYKITCTDLDIINEFREYLIEHDKEKIGLAGLVLPIKFEGNYKCDATTYCIYSQDRVINEYRTPSSKSPCNGCFTIDFANHLYSNIGEKALPMIEQFAYLVDKFGEIYPELEGDFHNGNWGFDKEGFPVYFDPLFIKY